MILRNVAGILHETWLGVITKHFLNSPEGRVYLDAMDSNGKEALEKLKKLFGKSGFLAGIATILPSITQRPTIWKQLASWRRLIPPQTPIGIGILQNRVGIPFIF